MANKDHDKQDPWDSKKDPWYSFKDKEDLATKVMKRDDENQSEDSDDSKQGGRWQHQGDFQ